MKNGKQDLNINFNEEMTVNGFLEAISEMEYPQYLLDAISAVQDWLKKLIVNIEDDEEEDDGDDESIRNEKIKVAPKPDFNFNSKSGADIEIEFEVSPKSKSKSQSKANQDNEEEAAEDVENIEVEDEDDDDEDYEYDDPVDFLKKMFEGEEIEEMDIEDSLGKLFEKIDSIDDKVDVIPNTHKPEGNRDAMIISVLAPDCEGGLRTAIDYAAVFNRKKCKRVWIISDAFVFDNAAHFSGHINALEKQGISVRFILVNPWGWVELPLSRASASRKQFTWRSTASRCDKGDKLNGD